MNVSHVVDAFNQQMRRDPPVEPGWVTERDPEVTRIVGPSGGWRGVIWSDLSQNAEEIIRAQVARLAYYEGWEWKLYSYDRPADLAEKLMAAGFVPDAEETVLIAALGELDVVASPPPGVELVPVVDQQGVDAVVAVHDEVFGGSHEAIGRSLLARLQSQRVDVAAVLAVADGIPIAAGRVEFPKDRDFASIWGGGTLPAWRGRGVFRALVAYRAALAAARGYRYLQVDASPESCPILKRLGFTEIATTTPLRYLPDARLSEAKLI